MKKTNLQQKLFDNGLIEEGDIDKIDNFKKQYRSEYSKAYNQEYREKTIRKTLLFNTSEFDYLEAQAKVHKMKLSPFLKAVIFSYLESTFIFIGKDKLSTIETILREINGRIAQSIQYVHLSNEVSLRDIEALKVAVFDLEKSIKTTLNSPPKIETWIEDNHEKNGLFVSKLLESIAQFLTKNHDS
ncbi:hypothetical protein ACFLSU_07635 [Bacteroidota bacterium]